MMPAKKLGPTGVGRYVNYSFNDEMRAHIELLLDDDHGRPFEHTVKRLEEAIGLYFSMQEVAEKSRLSLVKRNLAKTCNRIDGVIESLNTLDGNSVMLLADANNSVEERKSLVEISKNLLNRVSAARALAESYQSAGRQPTPHRDWLVINVADILEDLTGEPVSTNINGQFLSILEVVRTAALGKDEEALETTARRILKDRTQFKITHPCGLVEFRTPRDLGEEK